MPRRMLALNAWRDAAEALEPSWEKGYNGRHLQPFPP